MAAAAEIPVVDLCLAGASPEESALLREACERLDAGGVRAAGCVRVTGHDVPRELLAEMKAAVRALFDLPSVQTHMESGFLTVLQEDKCVDGLKELDPATGEFMPVDLVTGAFLINMLAGRSAAIFVL